MTFFLFKNIDLLKKDYIFLVMKSMVLRVMGYLASTVQNLLLVAHTGDALYYGN